jgi:nucleoid DNA-binding protein
MKVGSKKVFRLLYNLFGHKYLPFNDFCLLVQDFLLTINDLCKSGQKIKFKNFGVFYFKGKLKLRSKRPKVEVSDGGEEKIR